MIRESQFFYLFFSHVLMDQDVTYIGKDLEAMSFATNYHRWILQLFAPYLGRRVVEVGAGTGAFSELILEQELESLSLIEPSASMHGILKTRIEQFSGPVLIETYNSLFAAVADHLKDVQRPDSIVYVNVLEHIPHDEAELKKVHTTLCAGGRVFVFVPALPRLFGSFDRQVGHQRRYTKSELEDKCRRSGFNVIKSGYFDFMGILPWWIKHCFFRSPNLGTGSVKFYDTYIVPAAKVIETALPPPVGKNIFLIAEKSKGQFQKPENLSRAPDY